MTINHIYINPARSFAYFPRETSGRRRRRRKDGGEEKEEEEEEKKSRKTYTHTLARRP